MAPDFDERTAAAAKSLKSTPMAVSLSIVTVTPRDPVRLWPSLVNLDSVYELTNFPASPTALPDPYLVRTSGTRRPRLSVVTVTFKYFLRRYVKSRVLPVRYPDSKAVFKT